MGCWNKTCGLSNLHITDNKPVYTFILVQNGDEGRCYNNAFYTPILVPFECDYNDYGGGKNERGVAITPLMNMIKQECYIDGAKNVEVDIDMFFDLIHDNKIAYKDVWGKTVLIDFVMMRKDVVDYVLDNWAREVYVDGLGYQPYTFQEVVNEIPAFIDVIAAEIRKWQDPDDPVNSIMFSMFKINSSDSFTSLFEPDPVTNKLNLVTISLHHDIRTPIFSINEYIVNLIIQNKIDEVTEFITDYIKGTFVNNLIAKTRKQWLPGCHEGSQACDHGGYRMLIEATTKILDTELYNLEHDID